MLKALERAIENVFVCPVCKGQLVLEEVVSYVRCTCCQRAYSINDGIPVFLRGELVAQEEERQFRDVLADEYIRSDPQTLLGVVARHHCIPVMRKHAEEFRAKFKPNEWLLDVGIGYGWHWAGQGVGAKIIGVDMSLGNLILARHLLGEQDDVVLVCADAAALPIRESAISGVWSVQMFQHLPKGIFHIVQRELNRVLRDEFVMEICNLNPACLHKVIYCLFGREFHRQGKLGNMELNRLSAIELIDVWRPFRNGYSKISHDYSELFFHPDFNFRPRRYPLQLEHALATHFPKLAALFARQVHVRIERLKDYENNACVSEDLNCWSPTGSLDEKEKPYEDTSN
ncbi:methyltransferase domain-containing protein [Nitrospiraceae bacterium AH_259_D15_M11_P09]|nr:methyltransferase domain-containing protein [Nitrospiraceae bacterium AH_259_D15_M11_P09]